LTRCTLSWACAQSVLSWPTPRPQAPPPALTGGSCGYGNLAAVRWPYGMVAALSASSPLLQGAAARGACGTCVEVVCNDAVRTGSQCGRPCGGGPAGRAPTTPRARRARDALRARQACLPNVQSAVVLVTDACAECGPTQLRLAAPVYYQHLSRSPAVAVHYRTARGPAPCL
jgi:hypothetical protein